MSITKNEHAVIHTATVAAAGIAASPIPFSDAFLLVPIQTSMIMGLYKANGVNISQGFVEGCVRSTLVSNLGKSAVGNIVKLLPGVGSVAGAAINATVAVAFTEALGFSVASALNGSENADLIDLASVVRDTYTQFKNN